MALGLGSLGRAGGGRLGGPTAMPSSGTELPGGSAATYDATLAADQKSRSVCARDFHFLPAHFAL